MKKATLFSRILFAVGMAAATFSFGQVKIGTNPTVMGASNNLEVEASTAGRKVMVNKTTGKVTIADGSQADGSILTSDANGVATWKTKSSIRMEETVFIGEQSGSYTITVWDGVFNSLKDRIPLVPRPGSLPGYDPATKLYTIQESGYYRVYIGAAAGGTLPPASPPTVMALYLYPYNTVELYPDINNATGPVLSAFWQGYMAAGTPLSIYVTSQGRAQNINVVSAFLSVTKLF